LFIKTIVNVVGHTYNNLNKLPRGTVIVLVIQITLTIIGIKN
jgi:hypothetical protein